MRSRTRTELTRRDFLLGASVAAGAFVAAPVMGLGGAALSQTVRSPAEEEDLDAYIRRQMRVAYLPSLSTEVVSGTEVIRSRAYGWANIEGGLRATSDTPYILASTSKTVICAAVMQLWEYHRIRSSASRRKTTIDIITTEYRGLSIMVRGGVSNGPVP